MKKRIAQVTICMILLSTPAYAADYQFAAPDAGLFGTPTSDETVYVTTEEPVNTDRSKNAALVPPTFGSATSYVLNSGEPLTPNLLPNHSGNSGIGTGGITVMPPSVFGNQNSSSHYEDVTMAGYTEVTSNLYYTGGHLGILRIPAIGLEVKIYQGTDNATLRKGVGHFKESSIWDGNVALAAHNRGANNYFGKIHTLRNGNSVQLKTKLGTREYEVYSVSKISNSNTDVINQTMQNEITLVTCVRNQPEYRWCVKAREK